jgi:hypothetical protein
LTYAPTGSRGGVAVAEPVVKERETLMSLLKSGKRLLREQSPAEAFVEFEKALEIARKLKDTVEEKKAARGLGKFTTRTKNNPKKFSIISRIANLLFHILMLSSVQQGRHASGRESTGKQSSIISWF